MSGRKADLVRWAALVVVAGFAVREITAHWAQFRDTLGGIGWMTFIASSSALVASLAVSAYGWQAVVDGLGEGVGYRCGARICLVGQLGKYVPGSVWAYLMQMELARQAGLSRARVFTGSLIYAAIGLVAAALAYALASRVMFTLADLVTTSLAAGTPRRRRSGKPLEGTAARPD
ncbi:hypothetical protein [Amycolatopsis pigmentata]|uniref:Uncharacterized protein n=1 Tax=Amycolatopsis pigmentata TaxID=450801 RepID=A0ABW5FWA7_9PSEU